MPMQIFSKSNLPSVITSSMSRYYIEYGGGLGDIFHQIYTNGQYQFLYNLKEPVKIGLICHNPYAKELFQWHPNSHLFDIVAPGYWAPRQDNEKAKHGLPNELKYVPTQGEIVFYPNEEDKRIIEQFKGKKFLILTPNAGVTDKNIPENIVKEIIEVLSKEYMIVSIGRNYERFDRKETYYENTVDLIDKLSVPGTAELVRLSQGIITCHSSINLLGWHLKKPQLLLYPQYIYDGFMSKDGPWSFGRNYLDTVHLKFAEYNKSYVEKFLGVLHNGTNTRCNWQRYIEENKNNGRAWYHGLVGTWWWGMSEEQYIDTVCTREAEKLNLPNVTLLIADCVNAKRAETAIEICKHYADFGCIKFLTSLQTDSPYKVTIEKIRSRVEYSNFCIKKMNDYVDTDYVLVVQYDGFILNPLNWDPRFLHCDYIGAPMSSWPASSWMNGGFSLRSKKLLRALQSDAIPLLTTTATEEDQRICVEFKDILTKKYAIEYASRELADKFSSDVGIWEGQFGFHSAGINRKNWKAPLCAYSFQQGVNKPPDEEKEKKKVYSRDIVEHIPFLRYLASRSEIILELGLRDGQGSTKAFDEGFAVNKQGKLWIGVDIDESILVKPKDERFRFVLGDSTCKETVKTVRALLKNNTPDLVFIDTIHTPAQIAKELDVWSCLLSDSTICVFHDTWMNGQYNHMTNVIKGYAKKFGFRYFDYSTTCNGLGLMYK